MQAGVQGSLSLVHKAVYTSYVSGLGWGDSSEHMLVVP